MPTDTTIAAYQAKLADLKSRRQNAISEKDAHYQRLNQEWDVIQKASTLMVASLDKEIAKTEGVLEYLGTPKDAPTEN